jgi:tRNA U34 5-methylaminomethyl-2-thiouridine-forming methyltransferase MnmC
VGETMHNPVGPWAESNSLYIGPSKLRERLKRNELENNRDLVIFDVGLGAAANALAALHCAKEFPGARLHLISFEKDLELLRFALSHSHRFAHFHGFEAAISELLEKGIWTNGLITWTLRRGNFLESIEAENERPDLIFYDPYSPKMNQEMWTTECFRKVRAICREPDDGGTLLCTYSQSTPIRSALIAAGFFVGQGIGTGLKEETTQAATNISDLSEPLGARWLGRFSRSRSPLPLDWPQGDELKFKEMIFRHPQFLRHGFTV